MGVGINVAENRKTNQEILEQLPADVARIGVIDETGTECWRKPDGVRDTDVIRFNSDGDVTVMSGNPGRPHQDVLSPATKVVGELLRRKKKRLDEDPLRKALSEAYGKGPVDPIYIVLQGISEEIASLQFSREEADRQGDTKDSGTFSLRRINGLKALADTLFKRSEHLASSGVDLKSPAFNKIFEHILSTVFDAMEKRGVDADTVQAVSTDVGKIVDSDHWKAEAEKRILEG